MQFSVPSHLSYCAGPAGVIFLDVRRDRYFALPADLERDFAFLLDGQGAASEQAVDRLTGLGVLQAENDGARRQSRLPSSLLWPALTSWLDTPPEHDGSGSIADQIAVVGAVLRVQARLRVQTLEAILARLSSRLVTAAPSDLRAMQMTARTFHNARRWAGPRPICLLDSLSLIELLTRRGLRPHLVFGVIAQPFHAHCWVQIQDVVLNDRLDHVLQYTPILVV